MGGHERAPQAPQRSEAPRRSRGAPRTPGARKRPGEDAWRSEAPRWRAWRSEAPRRTRLAGHAADVGGAGFHDAAVADVAGIVDRLEGGDHMAELVGVDLEGKGRG